MRTKDIVQSYYDSLAKKNEDWKALYAEDAVFYDASKTLNARGKKAVIESFIPFLKQVEAVKVKHLMEENGSACAIVNYDYVNPKGLKMSQDVAEVWRIRDGKLSELAIYFDLTAYRSFMRG
jgi:ketosteroid isomerase-like protein